MSSTRFGADYRERITERIPSERQSILADVFDRLPFDRTRTWTRESLELLFYDGNLIVLSHIVLIRLKVIQTKLLSLPLLSSLLFCCRSSLHVLLSNTKFNRKWKEEINRKESIHLKKISWKKSFGEYYSSSKVKNCEKKILEDVTLRCLTMSWIFLILNYFIDFLHDFCIPSCQVHHSRSWFRSFSSSMSWYIRDSPI